ncbi:hypothetical protein [Snodgrassella alvi]|uniref:hypothetical protein n=1 Tax=Snodgrassella alvi TaxID=1196083 RepID=UPI00214982AE|nr:hypothetical protein [Snodgrassella alvi]
MQDTAKYNSKQQNISGQVTVGYGASASASFSKSKIKTDYAAVTEQSGIIAGDNGYQLNIKVIPTSKVPSLPLLQQPKRQAKNK